MSWYSARSKIWWRCAGSSARTTTGRCSNKLRREFSTRGLGRTGIWFVTGNPRRTCRYAPGCSRFGQRQADRRSVRSARHLPMAQEMKKLDAFAQAPAQHLRALEHLRDQFGDLFAAEVKALVEGLERQEDLGMRQMRVVQWCYLHPALVDQFGMPDIEPAVFDRLPMQISAG